MIGRFGDQAIHLPTGKRGKVVMHPSGSMGILSTSLDLGNGQILEFPDSELRLSADNGSLKLGGMRFASNRPIPAHMQVTVTNNGDGTVGITGQIPGAPAVTLHNLPIQNGEVVLPDEVFFPINR